jgi:hypothetical protein
MKRVFIIIGFIVVAVFAAAYFFFIFKVENFTIKELQVKEIGVNVYFKSLERGLNYSESSISTSRRRRSNPRFDYVYPYSQQFFYRISNDSLFVFCSTIANEPKNFGSVVKVIQIEYSNREYRRLMENYKSLGLEKFPD